MENQKITKCKTCNAEISKSAKVCPSCGAKNSKPLYMRPWFIILAILLVIIIATSSGNNDTPATTISQAESSTSQTNTTVPEPEVIEYTPYTVDKLVDDLNENALSAKMNYDGKYVELTGDLCNIDASGDYITLQPMYDEWSFDTIQCYIETEEQLTKVASMKTGDKVVLRGQVTDVGEILGYFLEIHEIVS